MVVKGYLVIFLTLSLISATSGQSCFDAYELLFKDSNKDLTFQEFHKLELEFVQNLKGCKAPDFEVVSQEGDEFLLTGLQGKVVVLNFWFTTCPPCLKEIPELNKIVQQFSNEEVVFLGFARDSKAELSLFFKRYGSFDYQIIPESYTIATTYKVVAWPQSMVIDKKGNIFRTWAGIEQSSIQLANEIKTTIQECLNEPN